MTRPDASPDRPFPGAHSQVPHGPALPAVGDGSPGQAAGRLPLDAAWTATDGGWTVRVPVRAERVAVGKEVVVYEQARIRRQVQAETDQVHERIRRERLRTQTEGQVELANRDEIGAAHRDEIGDRPDRPDRADRGDRPGARTATG